jgi:hypothetical protein
MLFEASNQHSLVPSNFEAPRPANILQQCDRELGAEENQVRQSGRLVTQPASTHYVNRPPSVEGPSAGETPSRDGTSLDRSPLAPELWDLHWVWAGPEAGSLAAAASRAWPEKDSESGSVRSSCARTVQVGESGFSAVLAELP